jgi:hypothetical protein
MNVVSRTGPMLPSLELRQPSPKPNPGSGLGKAQLAPEADDYKTIIQTCAQLELLIRGAFFSD